MFPSLYNADTIWRSKINYLSNDCNIIKFSAASLQKASNKLFYTAVMESMSYSEAFAIKQHHTNVLKFYSDMSEGDILWITLQRSSPAFEISATSKNLHKLRNKCFWQSCVTMENMQIFILHSLNPFFFFLLNKKRCPHHLPHQLHHKYQQRLLQPRLLQSIKQCLYSTKAISQ